MSDSSPTLELSLHLALLSFMAVGGGLVMIAPEVSQYVVNEKHWILSEQFAAAYSMAQAAPGPNLLFITLVGWLVAGWAGAISVTLAIILPSAALTLFVAKERAKRASGRLSRALHDAFSPMSTGLLSATALIFMQTSNVNWRADMLTLLTAAIVVRTKINPVILIGLGAWAGIAHVI